MKPTPAERIQAQATPSSRSLDDERNIRGRGKSGLNEVEIHELGRRVTIGKGSISSIAHGKLLAGMTVENAALIGHYLNDKEYYFRLGELYQGRVIDLPGGLESDKRDQAIAGWIHSDLESAMTWYESLPRKGEGSQKTYALGIAKGLTSIDLNSAEEFAHTWLNQAPFLPGRIVTVIFKKRALISDFPQLGEWANTVTNDGALDWKMLTQTAERACLNDPALAIEWAANLPANRDWVNDRIASRWKEQDPGNCSQWLLTRKSGPERDRSVSSSFQKWAQTDRDGCLEFLAGIESPHDRNLALSGIAWQLNSSDPEGAIAMARQMTDPERRESQVLEIARSFYRRQPQKAEAWFPESGLSPEQIEEIRPKKR